MPHESQNAPRKKIYTTKERKKKKTFWRQYEHCSAWCAVRQTLRWFPSFSLLYQPKRKGKNKTRVCGCCCCDYTHATGWRVTGSLLPPSCHHLASWYVSFLSLLQRDQQHVFWLSCAFCDITSSPTPPHPGQTATTTTVLQATFHVSIFIYYYRNLVQFLVPQPTL